MKQGSDNSNKRQLNSAMEKYLCELTTLKWKNIKYGL